MSMELIIRCQNCGKALRGTAERGEISSMCPRCGERFTIPDPVPQENRKTMRAITGESKLVQPIPQTLTKSKESPILRVTYTEVPPVEFVLKRSTHVPLLDLSEGGMGLLMRADEKSDRLSPGDVFVAEIDFPILVQSIFVQVEVCWIRPVKEYNLVQVGVRFCESDEDFRNVLKNLIGYITLRTESPDFDKWGSFG